jgi:calpain-15
VIVDDQFPCLYKRPIFSSANGKELWVLVLEKVWAKIHGSYKRIEYG